MRTSRSSSVFNRGSSFSSGTPLTPRRRHAARAFAAVGEGGYDDGGGLGAPAVGGGGSSSAGDAGTGASFNSLEEFAGAEVRDEGEGFRESASGDEFTVWPGDLEAAVEGHGKRPFGYLAWGDADAHIFSSSAGGLSAALQSAGSGAAGGGSASAAASTGALGSGGAVGGGEGTPAIDAGAAAGARGGCGSSLSARQHGSSSSSRGSGPASAPCAAAARGGGAAGAAQGPSPPPSPPSPQAQGERSPRPRPRPQKSQEIRDFRVTP